MTSFAPSCCSFAITSLTKTSGADAPAETPIFFLPNSSNSNRLREVAQNQGVEAYMVDNASYLKREWLIGKKKIGVSAGASAPEVLVKEVIAKLQQLGAKEVTELQGVIESVVFQLPKNLTSAQKTV